MRGVHDEELGDGDADDDADTPAPRREGLCPRIMVVGDAGRGRVKPNLRLMVA